MSYALVGTIGAVSTGSASAAVTPVFGTGESRTAGNLLLLWVTGYGTTTLPAAPAGWSIALQEPGSSLCSASLFYKIAAGADAAPTVGAVASTILSARLAEYSGNGNVPLDQSGVVTGTTSTQVATAGGTDTAPGELVVYCAAERYTTAATKTNSVALNNGATATDTNNNATSITNHYNLGYGVTTGNGAADAATLTFTTTNISSVAVVVVSFKLSGVANVKPLTASQGFAGAIPKATASHLRAPQIANYVVDPSFEYDTIGFSGANWGPFSEGGAPASTTFGAQTGWAASGTQSLRVTTGSHTLTTNQLDVIDNSLIPAVGLGSYSGSAVVNVLSVGSAGWIMQIDIQWLDSVGAFISGSGIGTQTSGTGIQTVTLTNAIAPSNAATGKLIFYVTGGTGVMDLYLDKVIVVQSPVLPTYADGDQVGYTWSGTPGQSTTLTPLVTTFSLSFTGARTNRTGKAMSGGSTFVGAIRRAITKGKGVDFLPHLGFAGTLSRLTQVFLAALLGLVGRVLVPLRLTAALSFIGNIAKSARKGAGGDFAPQLGFAGSVLTALRRGLTASLAFTGNSVKTTARGLLAGISFAGSLPRALLRALAAALSFTGSFVARRIVKAILAGAVSFTGSVSRGVAHGLAAALTSAGVSARATAHGLAGALMFTTLFIANPHVVIGALLDFAGSVSRRTTYGLSGAVSFVGAIPARVSRALAAVGTFAGNLARQTQARFIAGLTQTGTMVRAIARPLTGALGFSGLVLLNLRYILTATLTATGTLTRRGGHVLVAAVSFSGATVRATVHSLAATLGLQGLLGRAVATTLAAALNWSGALMRTGSVLLSAALSLTGNLARGARQTLTANLSFSGRVDHLLVVAFLATLSFAGSFLSPFVRVVNLFLALRSTVTNLVRRDVALTVSAEGVEVTPELSVVAVQEQSWIAIARADDPSLMAQPTSLSRLVAQASRAGNPVNPSLLAKPDALSVYQTGPDTLTIYGLAGVVTLLR